MADLRHGVAICTDDNRRIGIEEVYTLSSDGKQINIPGVVEAIRKLGKENKLECECGCGGKLMLKAGEAMIMKQHFAMKPGQGISDCRSTVETDYTRMCKGILKCWLDATFSLVPGEVEYNYPYSKIEEGSRRYEFTHYVPKYNYGVIFSKTSTIDPDKLSYFSQKDGVCFLAVAPAADNIQRNGQYPEYAMRMQDAQGFCAFLEPHDDYALCKLSIVRYELTYKRVWHNIVVFLDIPLSRFSVSQEGVLLCDGKSVMSMVNEHIVAFKDYDLACAECERKAVEKRKAKEAERKREAEEKRLEYEKRLKKIKEEEEEQKRLDAERAAEAERRREVAIQKQLAEEEAEKIRVQKLVAAGEEYLMDFPSKKAIYEVVKNSYRVEGTFLLLRNGSYLQGKVVIMVSAAWYNGAENNIVIKDVKGKIYLIHLQHFAGDRPKPSSMPDGGYWYYPYFANKFDEAEGVKTFTSFFKCSGSKLFVEDKVIYGCKLKEENREIACFDYMKNTCGKPDSSCSYKVKK